MASPSDVRLVRINLIGTTGSGKSTFAKRLAESVEAKGGKCLIVSADKWSKKGKKGKEVSNCIKNEFKNFYRVDSKLKVVIIDLCNENGPQDRCFDIDFTGFETHDMFPNMNRQQFNDYECWCLRNVLSRPAHTENTLYWLNPVTAGVSTCIKVHKGKTQSLRRYCNITSPQVHIEENWTLEQTLGAINESADRYAQYLNGSSVEAEVSSFMNTMGL